MVPSPLIARSAGVILCLQIVLTHVYGIQRIFAQEAYLGVGLILAIGMALAVAACLLVQDGEGVWLFAFVIGSLNALGVVLSRVFGLPLLRTSVETQPWFSSATMVLGVSGGLLACLAAWVLFGRRLALMPDAPVTSAQEREARVVQRGGIPLPRLEGADDRLHHSR